MNFKTMPELEARFGYEAATAVTVIATAATYWYFKKKKWF